MTHTPSTPANPAQVTDAKELADRITDYLTNGGLFNPEMMPHGPACDLLIDCRAALTAAIGAGDAEPSLLDRERAAMDVTQRRAIEGERISDAVLAWMVKYDLLDAGNEYHASDVLAVLNDLAPSDRSAAIGAGGQAVAEGLRLTEYEVQVLLGTSISGCNMSPDRVFSLDMAWHRLYALDLIDRTDGLAIVTEKGKRVIDAILSAIAHPVQPGWRESLLDKLAEHKNFELSWGAHPDDDTEACWQVHRVNGGRNDREWTLIGVGNTPHEALYAALPAAPQPKGE